MEGFEDSTLLRRTIHAESTTSTQTDLIPPPRFDINYRFSFQTVDNGWIIRQDSDIWQFHGRQITTMTEKFVSLNLEQFMNYTETCGALHKLLGDWPVSNSSREIVVDFVWRTTRHDIKTVPRRCHTAVIHLHFHLAVLNTYVHIEEEEEDEDEDTDKMIPAAGWSILSLEREVIEGGGSCSICMDDLCEGLRMPCFHVFHDYCIVTWLGVSHYCPLCRLEMPISC